MEGIQEFENRANKAEVIIEDLTKRIAQLEDKLLNTKAVVEAPKVSSSTETVSAALYKELLEENTKLKAEVDRSHYRINHLLRHVK
ncbi:hypothetical protein CYY_007111 [Polysphondylium violaceum]|uniref:Uncharacterized protein n=1 Tax=Polysphondylium violaceum TaxID=133409 RepID=A0A8J4UY81_9MYCE|nr:hypothetical protein CYY_007111 [Polysphondylium violaceum]